MFKICCDWCQKDIKGRSDRYARHHFCSNDDCKNKYRRFIEGKIQFECTAAVRGILPLMPYEDGGRADHSQTN
jgi:hypothetical protein